MIETISTLSPWTLLRADWIVRLALIAVFPLVPAAPLLGGSLSTQGPVSRQPGELAEEETAIRCTIVSSIRRLSQAGPYCLRVSRERTTAYRSNAKLAPGRGEMLVSFRGAGHRLNLSTLAPFLC